MRAGARFRLPLPPLIQHLGFTVLAFLAYVLHRMATALSARPPRPDRPRDDREADSRRGPNPQRGEPSCRSQPRISQPSRAFSPPATSGCAIRGAADLHLILPRSRALMYTRLTPPRRENHVEDTIEQQIAELSRMTVGQARRPCELLRHQKGRPPHEVQHRAHARGDQRQVRHRKPRIRRQRFA